MAEDGSARAPGNKSLIATCEPSFARRFVKGQGTIDDAPSTQWASIMPMVDPAVEAAAMEHVHAWESTDSCSIFNNLEAYGAVFASIRALSLFCIEEELGPIP